MYNESQPLNGEKQQTTSSEYLIVQLVALKYTVRSLLQLQKAPLYMVVIVLGIVTEDISQS